MKIALTVAATILVATMVPAMAAQQPFKITPSLGGGAPAAKPAPPPAAPGKLSTSAVQQNPLALLQQFSVADLQAAITDANAQTPPDTVGANCWTALLTIVQSDVANPFPTTPGVFAAWQKARDAKAMLANLQSPTGPLAGLNTACAPVVMDAQNTLLTLGVSVGLVASPAGGAAALAGLPAAVAAFLALPKL